ILTGDADCISSGELSGRRHMRTSNYSLITGGFFWFSDNEVPIDVRRPRMPDDDIFVNKTGATFTKIFFDYLIPILLLLFGIIIWVRRKGR
ncbi:MAG: ABC transporter, partial [Bacilli bacterium]